MGKYKQGKSVKVTRRHDGPLITFTVVSIAEGVVMVKVSGSIVSSDSYLGVSPAIGLSEGDSLTIEGKCDETVEMDIVGGSFGGALCLA